MTTFQAQSALTGNIWELKKFLLENTVALEKACDIIGKLCDYNAQDGYCLWDLDPLLEEDREFLLDYCPNFTRILWNVYE